MNSPSLSGRRSRLFVVGLVVVLVAVTGVVTPSGVRVAQAALVVQAPAGVRIVGPAPGNASTPVVNENRELQLRVLSENGQTLNVSSWESDSPTVARVTPAGVLQGKVYGFATVTATTNQGAVKGFVVVVRVTKRQGAKAQGDTKTDTSGNVYLSDPRRHVIWQPTGATAKVVAGSVGHRGYMDGTGEQALFDTPTGLAVDNTASGGVYVADTANDCIRKITVTGRVEVALGTPGVEGTMTADSTPIVSAVMKGPKGVAVVGRNYYFTDTENHAIYFADYQKGEVRVFCGEPGMAGNSDGGGRAARFNRPSGMAISTDGRLLAVADTGNNIVRLVEVKTDGAGNVYGEVASLGVGSSGRGVEMTKARETDDARDTIAFAAPESVSLDTAGNVYVIDQEGASVVTRAKDQLPRKVELAQAGTLGDPVSVTLKGSQVFVLDEAATEEASAISVAEVGAPAIDTVTPATGRLEGGEDVVIEGRNFSPESKVTLGDGEVADYAVESATRIRLRTPSQTAPGGRTLTVLTRGGVAQRLFGVRSKTLAELQPGEITTVAGGVPFTGDGGTGPNASFLSPSSVAVDANGNVYIADTDNNRIRRVDSSGRITTVAGTGVSGYDGDGRLATSTKLTLPRGVAVDGSGNLYIADWYNSRIRRVDPSGRITTVAGTGIGGYDGDDKPATSASLNYPADVAVDGSGNLYIADLYNHRIRRVDSSGRITTVAGTGEKGYNGDDMPATSANLNFPYGLAVDGSGNLYVADTYNSRIRRVDSTSGRITTVAGTGVAGYDGDDKPASSALLDGPTDLVVDGSGNLYIADRGNARIRRVDSGGQITTVAGGGSHLGDGGLATSASLFALGVAVDGSGNLYIADAENARIRRVSGGRITTLAGMGKGGDIGDGALATLASLARPHGVAVDGSGNLYVADSENDRIRRVDSSGWITTVAGKGARGYNGDDKPATLARLNYPHDVAVDGSGNLYVADYFNNRIRRVDSSGRITTVAGTGEYGDDGDGKRAALARLAFPSDVAFDGSGNLYIADTDNNRIRRVDSRGRITTVAGTGEAGYNGDDKPATSASLNHPLGVAVDSSGDLFIADAFNNRIRRVDSTSGRITTVAGTGSPDYNGDDMPATSASLAEPSDVAVDGSGNLYIADTFNCRIRRVDSTSGRITTVAGTEVQGYDGDDKPATLANLDFPKCVTVDGSGYLYVGDTFNNAIRVVRLQGGVGVPTPSIERIVFKDAAGKLVINGRDLGTSGATVVINDVDVSSRIRKQADRKIVLRGSAAELALQTGTNAITVTVNGVTSAVFVVTR